MPSHVNPNADPFAFDTEEEHHFPVRTAIEWALRAISLVTLVFLIWEAFHLLHERPSGRAESGKVRSAFATWSTTQLPNKVHVVFDSVPTPDLRDWLAAFPAAGTQMSWEGVTLKPSAVTVEPIADPQHSARVWVAAQDSGKMVVRDSLGIIDTVSVHAGGAVLTVPHVNGTVRSSIGGTTASSALRDSLTIKPVLILGIASWEGKFILASLEEHGWKADARFVLSPLPGGLVVQGIAGATAQGTSGSDGRGSSMPDGPRIGTPFGQGAGMPEGQGGPNVSDGQEAGMPDLQKPGLAPVQKRGASDVQAHGGPLVIDTAHYSAVIALDSSAAKYSGAIEAFVRQGGGFIATGDAASVPAFQGILPGMMGAPIPLGENQSFDVDSVVPRMALALTPVRQLKPNAVAVEKSGNNIAVAAWRINTGRALQVGYTDTWRWRMAGLAGSVDAYRLWWSNMVSSVAYAPRYPRVVSEAVEPTPMASLVNILGAPQHEVAEKGSPWDDPRLMPALFALLMAAFLLEWASRRLRGRP